MTTAIYSNNEASNSLGNIFGYSGPKDWVLRLDFVREMYEAVISGNKQRVNYANFFSVQRAQSAAFFNDANVIQSVGPDTLRVGKISRDGGKGLIFEDDRRNLFLSPNAPVTQSAVSLVMPASPVIILSCEGAENASVSLSGDIATSHNGTDTGATITAFAGKGPVVAFPTAGKSSWTFNYIVNGQLTNVTSMSQGQSAAAITPVIGVPAVGALFNQDKAQLLLSTFGDLPSNGTLLIVCEPSYAQLLATSHTRIAGVVSNTAKTAYVGSGARRLLNGQRLMHSRVRQNSTNTETTPAQIRTSKKVSFAYRWSPTKASVALDGVLINSVNGEGLVPNIIGIGQDSAAAWITASSEISGLRGVVQLIQLHNRELTDAELLELSNSTK